MKRGHYIIPAAALLVFGAFYYQSELESEREFRPWPLSLRQFVASDQGVPTYPKARESDVYQITRQFAATRRLPERIRSIRFDGDDYASLQLSERDCRGYPSISAHKKSGAWTLDWGRYR